MRALAWSYLWSQLYPGDTAWDDAAAALEAGEDTIAKVESRYVVVPEVEVPVLPVAFVRALGHGVAELEQLEADVGPGQVVARWQAGLEQHSGPGGVRDDRPGALDDHVAV